MKKVFLSGPMEYVANNGIEWRLEFSEKLKKYNIECIIPNIEEAKITNNNVDFKKLKEENVTEYIKLIRKFIEMDLNFINSSDFVLCKWDGEVSSGTMGELTYSYYLKKSSYLITSINKKDIPGWFLSCFTEIFNSLDGFIEYYLSNKQLEELEELNFIKITNEIGWDVNS